MEQAPAAYQYNRRVNILAGRPVRVLAPGEGWGSYSSDGVPEGTGPPVKAMQTPGWSAQRHRPARTAHCVR